MDPFQEFTDVDLWQALEKCHIKDMVSQCRAAVPMETGNLNRNSLMFFYFTSVCNDQMVEALVCK